MGWSLMIFCARATRGLRRPSLDARSGRSISPHPLRGDERAWREHYKACSFNARIGKPSGPLSREELEKRWTVRREKTPELSRHSSYFFLFFSPLLLFVYPYAKILRRLFVSSF